MTSWFVTPWKNNSRARDIMRPIFVQRLFFKAYGLFLLVGALVDFTGGYRWL
jgi:hypothetical protein